MQKSRDEIVEGISLSGPTYRGFESAGEERQVAMKYFRGYKEYVIQTIGHTRAMYDDEINQFGFNQFPHRFGGAVPNDKKLLEDKYYIVNTASSRGRGAHWVAVYITKKIAYVYDSFGRSTGRVLPFLVDNNREIRLVVDSDRHQEQRGASSVCGQLSLAWLMVLHYKGLGVALLI